jgi:hypothetical protein
MNRSHPEGEQLLLCISTVRTTLADPKIKSWDRQKKNAERRTKRAGASGRTRRLGKPREKLPSAGDVKNDTAGLWIKCNLREKRRDPWPRANAPTKSVADPEPVVKTRTKKSQACLDLVRRPVAQPPAEAS